MGHSASIAELAQKEDEYRDYLQKLKTNLEAQSKQAVTDMQTKINDFYNSNKYNKTAFIGGQNADFMQRSEWSMQNVKNIIDAIAKAVFGDSKAPEGVTIDKAEAIGAAISAMEHMEVYIAGKCFEVLSGVVESFGSSSSLSYQSHYDHKPLGYGLHLFTTVVADSYTSESFFKNTEIYEYLYIYEVNYSLEEAEAEAKIEKTKLYSDQIATFVKKGEDLLNKLSVDEITPEQYETLNAAYEKLIDASTKKLAELRDQKVQAVRALKAT
ncbi:MAG: hypothetical protein JSS57_16690 [Proteobacteria bacterium]|nr:hypothetical protein [Pseudomonadota bacterium]